jgi:hypothetical protein
MLETNVRFYMPHTYIVYTRILMTSLLGNHNVLEAFVANSDSTSEIAWCHLAEVSPRPRNQTIPDDDRTQRTIQMYVCARRYKLLNWYAYVYSLSTYICMYVMYVRFRENNYAGCTRKRKISMRYYPHALASADRYRLLQQNTCCDSGALRTCLLGALAVTVTRPSRLRAYRNWIQVYGLTLGIFKDIVGRRAKSGNTGTIRKG